MTLNNDMDNTFLSTLKYVESNIETDDNGNAMQQSLHSILQFTEIKQNIDALNSYKNGVIIKTLIDILNNELSKGNNSNKSILSDCIMILGRILSSSSNDTFTSMFIDEDGIETLYNNILLSSKYKKKESIIYSIVDFLLNINKNKSIQHQQIVLNNEEHQFIFQIASILKKNSLNYNFGDTMNRFSQLLCTLYHDNDDDDDDDDDDDENNIKSILNSLIFTGFVTTISKRTAMIKSDCTQDIMSMMNIILVLMDCNTKKTCSKFINSSVPQRILEFIASNKSDSNLLVTLFECLAKFYEISSKQTLNQLEENQYISVISDIDDKIKRILMNAIDPSSKSPSNVSIGEEKTYESTQYVVNRMEDTKEYELSQINENIEHMMVDISEQEEASTIHPETETESQTISPKTKQQSNGSMNDLPPIPDQIGSDGGSEMELVLDAISDIQTTILTLQQTMDDKTPQIVKKYVAEHHAPRYSGIEQQRFIDAETARIMAERREEEEEKMLQLAEIREENEMSDNDDEKDKGKGDDKLWSKFSKYYNKYIENSNIKRNFESLRNVLERLREFGQTSQKDCIDGLLHCKSCNTVIRNFLFCLEIRDDIIRENVIECLDSLYDLANDEFTSFTNNNSIIEYLSKALMVRHHDSMEKSQSSSVKNDLLSLTSKGSARVDMKILQVLAVNFNGKEMLYHRVFNKIKECIMSPYQHIDFVVYALQVIRTIIEDANDASIAKKWINRECAGDINMDHTIQCAVFIMQTYSDSEAAVSSRHILEALHIDIQKALIEYGMDIEDDNDVTDGLTAGGHNKQISNYYKHLERDQMRKTGDLKQWMLYIQNECNNSRINNAVLSDNQQIVNTLNKIKRFMMVHDPDEMWNCFNNLNSIHILCDLTVLILMGNNDLWNTLLIGILDIIVLYTNHKEDNTNNNESASDGYIMKCMIDILLRYLSISSKSGTVMTKACFVLDKMSKDNAECISLAVDYGGIECIFNVISNYSASMSQDVDKSLIVSSLNFLNNLISDNDENKKVLMISNGANQQILNMLRPSMHRLSDDDDDNEMEFSVISSTLSLLLSMTAVSKDNKEESLTISCNLILSLINQNNILNILYNAIELLQKDKKTLYLLMELLLNICSNCNKLSVDVQQWIVRIVLEFSKNFQKSQIIHCFMIKIVTAIIKHNPPNNVQIVLKQNGVTHVFEVMKLSQYKQDVVLMVFTFMKLICGINDELTKYFVTQQNIFKFIVHVMKNWYLNDKEIIESRIKIIQNCCQMISGLCFNDECSSVANQSHVTSSLIKLVIAHETDNTDNENKTKEIDIQRLKKNIYLNRIPMFCQVLKTIGALTKQNEDIALKVAKHAIKTMIKGVEMHINSDPNDKINNYHRVKSQNNPQHKLLLNVFIEYLSNIISYISAYLIKYDIGFIMVQSIIKYSDTKQQDFTMCCTLIDFLSLLLSVNAKAYPMLEHNDNKASPIINTLLSTQKNSYRSYQPLLESCHQYNKELKRCMYKLNSAQPSPIPIMQSTTNSISNMSDLGRPGGLSPYHPQHQHYSSANSITNTFYPQNYQSQPPPPPPNYHSAQPPFPIQTRPARQHRNQPQRSQTPVIGRQHHRPVFNQSHSQSGGFPHHQGHPPPPALPLQGQGRPQLHQTLSMNSIHQMRQQQRPQYPTPTTPTTNVNISMFNPPKPNTYHQHPKHNMKHNIINQLHGSLVQLLTTGSIMTKYPSIHTDTPSYLQKLNKMKSKPKIVRVSPDWQTIEFHNVPGIAGSSSSSSSSKNHKPPKVLPIGNMKYVDSSYTEHKRVIAKSKHSKALFIYGLDKNGKEIVIKLLCQNVNDAKRWTRALQQMINEFKRT